MCFRMLISQKYFNFFRIRIASQNDFESHRIFIFNAKAHPWKGLMQIRITPKIITYALVAITWCALVTKIIIYRYEIIWKLGFQIGQKYKFGPLTRGRAPLLVFNPLDRCLTKYVVISRKSERTRFLFWGFWLLNPKMWRVGNEKEIVEIEKEYGRIQLLTLIKDNLYYSGWTIKRQKMVSLNF